MDNCGKRPSVDAHKNQDYGRFCFCKLSSFSLIAEQIEQEKLSILFFLQKRRKTNMLLCEYSVSGNGPACQ